MGLRKILSPLEESNLRPLDSEKRKLVRENFATAQSAQYCLSSACSTALSAREGKLCVYRLIGQKDIFPPLLSRLLPFFFFGS